MPELKPGYGDLKEILWATILEHPDYTPKQIQEILKQKKINASTEYIGTLRRIMRKAGLNVKIKPQRSGIGRTIAVYLTQHPQRNG